MDNNFMFCTKCMYFNMLTENMVDKQSVPSACSSCASFCGQETSNVYTEDMTMIDEGMIAIA